jgi:hypothetical protein
MSTRDDQYTTHADAFDAGFEAGKESAKEKPSLTIEQIKKMTPAEINARKPEVTAALRASRARSGQ